MISLRGLDFQLDADVLCIDFDGVIKESVGVKGEVFLSFFADASAAVRSKILAHHMGNGGISRFTKMPLYLDMAQQSCGDVDLLMEQFSERMRDRVISSDWVPGVLEFLGYVSKSIPVVLVTATPQNEISDILARCGISGLFQDIYGFPAEKAEVLRQVVLTYDSSFPCFIGDSHLDYAAALTTSVPFILRTTEYITEIPAGCSRLINDFRELHVEGH